jgi:N-acylglucosamine 2-epimerase
MEGEQHQSDAPARRRRSLPPITRPSHPPPCRVGSRWSRLAVGSRWRLHFALNRDGSCALHFQRKPYSAVFYVLGCVEYARALEVRRAAGVADADADDPAAFLHEASVFVDRLQRWIDAPELLGRPAQPTSTSSLADVMCLASLAEQMLIAQPEKRDTWLAHVREAQRRVALHYDPRRHVLMESAHPTRGVDHTTSAGRLFNPGHSIEVCWFLLHLCALEPSDELRSMALSALAGSLERGWDHEHGGLYYMCADTRAHPHPDADPKPNPDQHLDPDPDFDPQPGASHTSS